MWFFFAGSHVSRPMDNSHSVRIGLPNKLYTKILMRNSPGTQKVDRVQTGIRLEKRILNVLKALAELKELSLGDLLEGIILHAFESKPPFSAATVKQLTELKKIYGLTLTARDSHRLEEQQARKRG
jgi:predicted DNA-binding ribbon-helix-helix protein